MANCRSQSSHDELVRKLHAYASEKRKRASKKVVISFAALVREAAASVPEAVQKLIKGDSLRTFGALPRGLLVDKTDAALEASQSKLQEILMAFTTRSLSSRLTGAGAGYTQGMNFIAAVCLVLFDGNAADAFWLFTALVEDTVGLHFYADWPSLLGIRATTQVVLQILPSVCPRLAGTLSDELEDLVSGYSTRFMLPLGARSLPKTCLLQLWHDLLEFSNQLRSTDEVLLYHQPLVMYLLSMFQGCERQLVDSLAEIPRDEPRLGTAMQILIAQEKELPLEWTPTCPVEKFCSQDLYRTAEKLVLARCEDEELTRHAHLPATLVQSLHAEFEQVSSSNGGVDKAALREIIERLLPQHTTPLGGMEAVQQLFNLLDSDGSGRLNFLQLMTGLLILCGGSREEKLRRLFDLYDIGKSNKLDKEQLLCLAKALASLKENIQPVISKRLTSPELDLEEYFPAKLQRIGSCPPAVTGNHGMDTPVSIHSTWVLRPDQIELAERYHQRMLMMDVHGNGEVYWDEFCFGFFSDPELIKCLKVFKELIVEDSAEREPESVLPHAISGHDGMLGKVNEAMEEDVAPADTICMCGFRIGPMSWNVVVN